MAWVSPRTWTVGQVVTAAQMNEIRDSLNAVGGTWTSYTPAIGGTGWALGNGTVNGFAAVAKTGQFWAEVVFGSTSTFGAGQLTVSLPATASANHLTYIGGIYYDSSAGATYPALFQVAASASVATCFTTASPAANVTSTAPFTWASGDRVRISTAPEFA